MNPKTVSVLCAAAALASMAAVWHTVHHHYKQQGGQGYELSAFSAIGSLSTRPVRIEYLGQRYDIPRQYLDMPLVPARNGVHVEDDLLVVGAAPAFAGRTTENLQMFRSPDRQTVRVLISPVINRAPQVALDLSRGIFLRPNETLSRSVDKSDRHYVQHGQTGHFNKGPGDLYVSPDGSFTVCLRASDRVISPGCQMFLARGQSIYQITFGAQFQTERHDIERAVVTTIDSWKQRDPP